MSSLGKEILDCILCGCDILYESMIEEGMFPMEVRVVEKSGSRGDSGSVTAWLGMAWTPKAAPACPNWPEPAWLSALLSATTLGGSKLVWYGGWGTQRDSGEEGTKTVVNSCGLSPVSWFILEFIAN